MTETGAPKDAGSATCWAIIPARGGSVGVPRKNVQPLGGKPLLAYVIEAARGARSVERVLVSTDDPEIASVAERFGAEVIRRPAELANATASSESAVLHALEEAALQGPLPDRVVFLQATSPLTLAEDIDGAVARLEESRADSCLSVTRFFHFLWAEQADGSADPIGHDKAHRPRRQDMTGQCLENGALYVFRTERFLAEKTRFCGQTCLYEMPQERSFEIDSWGELAQAEVLVRRVRTAARADLLPQRIGAVCFDFDGVFTDDRVQVDETGLESVACSRSDGLGLELLRKAAPDLALTVFSKERNPVVAARCAKLKIECQQSVDDKLTALTRWARDRDIPLSDIVFVGNDVNDVDCLLAVGCGACPADARDEAKRAARLHLAQAGGRGAVRDLTDLIRARFEARLRPSAVDGSSPAR